LGEEKGQGRRFWFLPREFDLVKKKNRKKKGKGRRHGVRKKKVRTGEKSLHAGNEKRREPLALKGVRRDKRDNGEGRKENKEGGAFAREKNLFSPGLGERKSRREGPWGGRGGSAGMK